MLNRLTVQFPHGLRPDDEAYGDFWVVSGSFGSVTVTAATAALIERELDAKERRPRWLVFRDRAGSKIRLRAREVRAVCESTAAQRAFDRRMDYLREREQRTLDRQFEDEE